MGKLESEIWGVLDSVRGYRDISELKELLVSLIFLKYANDKFISDSFTEIIVPKDARWEYISNNLGSYDFPDLLFNAFNVLEYGNDQLKDTLIRFDFRSEQNSAFISSLFRAISRFNFQNDKLDFSNILGDLLRNFANYEGKKGSDFTTPDSVSQLMMELINPEKGVVLDSTCGTGGFFQKIENNYPSGKFKFYGQEFNRSTLAIAKLRFAFNKKSIIQFGESKNTLENDQFPDLKADYVIMHPPFNVKQWSNQLREIDPRFEFGLPPKGNANFAWIQHAISHLNNNGKAALLLSNNSLSSGGKEGEIRKRLLAADLIEAIITLPSQLLAGTSIPSCIWLLNKNKSQKGKILFIDASDLGVMSSRFQRILNDDNILELSTVFDFWQKNDLNYEDQIGFVKSVDLNEIIENNFVLTPGRYLGIKELNEVDLSKAVKLGEILEYDRPERLDSDGFYKKVSIKDLSSNPDSYLLDTNVLEKGELRKDYRRLGDELLLIARLGSKIKPTYIKKSNDELAFSSNSIHIFKVDLNMVRLDYFIAELHKDYIKFQLDNFRNGTSMPIIRRQDLLDIQISIPSLREQKIIYEKEREVRFQSAAKDLGFEKEIEKLKQAQMKDLGSKKHNIMQHLNNVKSSADVLTEMMELNKGILKFDDIIDPRRGVTVEKRFLRLQESLDKVIYYVDNITNELKYDKAEIINPAKFIKECKERGIQNKLFSVENIVESATFEGREPLISISKNDFEEVYNNLLENAINHGFVDKNKSYIFRVTIAYIDDYLEINFVNNGKPFPKGIAQKIGVKGEKAGATAGTGIGLWKVTEIAKHFDCKLEVFDEPLSEFPVGFKFKFNIETL